MSHRHPSESKFPFSLLNVLFQRLFFPFSSTQSTEVLIIFTRYPQPGRCKTRLIPAVGTQGAALIQKEMTENICHVARKWQSSSPKTRRIEIHFSFDGETQTKDEVLFYFQCTLGRDLIYMQQTKGDLSTKLQHALEGGSRNSKLMVIASDTPSITVSHIEEGFSSLNRHQVVIGRAEDGGYYLIGFKNFIKEIVCGTKDISIPWSTGAVFHHTVQICQELGITIDTHLPALKDIDVPEDLDTWFQYRNMVRQECQSSLLSVVVPILNEKDQIKETLLRISTGRNIEIFIVDGGSTDGTLNIVRSFVRDIEERIATENAMNISPTIRKVALIESEKGRALQQNTGASHANGELLLFVHGDSELPLDYDEMIRQAFAEKNSSKRVAGAFTFEIEDRTKQISSVGRMLTQIVTNARAKLLKMPYGDQAIFLPRRIFQELKGFPSLSLMEDFELMRRLKRRGEVHILSPSVVTSGRRWKKLGVVRTTLINQCIIFSYLFGVSTERLALWYYK